LLHNSRLSTIKGSLSHRIIEIWITQRKNKKVNCRDLVVGKNLMELTKILIPWIFEKLYLDLAIRVNESSLGQPDWPVNIFSTNSNLSNLIIIRVTRHDPMNLFNLTTTPSWAIATTPSTKFSTKTRPFASQSLPFIIQTPVVFL
jgi:hypothetical protein